MNSTPPANAQKIEPQQTHQVGEFKYTCALLACRFDPSGQFIFGTAQDNTVQRWHLASGKATALSGHESWVRAMAFHPSGSTLYSGGYDGRVIWWPATAESPQPERTVEAHRGWVRAVAISPDGNLLATAGNDNLVKIWNVADGALLGECFGHTNHVYNVAFHPRRGTLVSGDLKGAVREWDVSSGEQLRQLDAAALWKYDVGFGADIGGVRSIAFREDGQVLACGGITEVSNAFAGIGNPLVVVFDYEKGEKQQQLVTKAKLRAPTTGVKFHRDGFVIGSCGGLDGGHLLFWRLDEPNEFFDLKLPDVARDLDLHPDQLRLATPHEDKTLRLWQMTAKVN
ncbi:MAG: WD40 repeat domain-containing protein [Planctomycetia bacterium]|nr:WD40 repeat domain-containing protein [Planctomycetia bacterium]